ncbi:hypothetical protein K438DRAFT_1976722 [Mycena galopus ATCC 62051]|nr:hypothetical protein K438DRAFT_1976722 [Mycena galopus ATCC 62051]
MSGTTAPPDIGPTYGAMLIGIFVAIFFQGILSVQAYIYYENFPEDSRILKSLVAALWTLDFAHLILICQAMYHYLISSWGDNAALMQTTIPLNMHLVLLSISTVTCQSFFLYRVWRFTKNNILTVILAAGSLTTGILDNVMAAQAIENTSIAPILSRGCTAEVVVTFVVGAAVDLSIAGILCWHLRREMTMFDRRVGVRCGVICNGARIKVLDSIPNNYSRNSRRLPSLLALSALVAYVTSPTYIFLAMNFSLGRVYTNALLATLNSRKDLRERFAPPGPSKWSGVSVAVFGTASQMSESENAVTTTQELPMTHIVEKPSSDQRTHSVDLRI